MTAPITPSLGSLAPPWRRLSSPGALPAPLILGRAQVSTRSTALGVDAATWAEYAADVPRFNGAARRLLIAGQRTNLTDNPRGEGAVVGVIGSGGVVPTGWIFGSGSGVTAEIVGTGIENGIPYVDVRRYGTPGGNSFRDTFTPNFSITGGVTYTSSFFLALVSGIVPGVLDSRLVFPDEFGTFITVTAGPLGSRRYFRTRTAPGTTTGRPEIRYTLAVGVAFDFTIRYGYPQFEVGDFASTPILPSIGTPAASTRGGDLVNATLASLGIGANAACTLLWSGMVPQAAPSGINENLLQLDDGTDSSRFSLFSGGSPGDIRVYWRNSAAASANVAIGTMTPGTPFSAGITIDGTGRIAGCFNGGAVQAVTGGPTSGLTTLRLGNNASNTAALFGEVGWLGSRPYAVSDAALPGLLSTLPL